MSLVIDSSYLGETYGKASGGLVSMLESALSSWLYAWCARQSNIAQAFLGRESRQAPSPMLQLIRRR